MITSNCRTVKSWTRRDRPCPTIKCLDWNLMTLNESSVKQRSWMIREQSVLLHTSEELEGRLQLPLLRYPEQIALCLHVEPRVYDHRHRPREPDNFANDDQ